MLFVHIKKNIHSIAWLEKKAEHALEPDEKIIACFFIANFLAYAMKSIITFLWWFVEGKCVGRFFCYHTFSSVFSSDLFDFRIKVKFHSIWEFWDWNFTSEHSQYGVNICFFSQIIFFLFLFLGALLSFRNGFQQLYVLLFQTWHIEFISCSLS